MGGCAGTDEYYRSTGETVLVQQSIIGPLGHVVLLQKCTIGVLGMCRYSRVLYCIGTEEYYRSTGEAGLVQKSTKALERLCRYSKVL